ACTSHARLHVKAEAAQVVSDETRCARLLITKLGVLVDVSPPGDDLRLLGRGSLPNLRLEIEALGVRTAREGQQQPCREDRAGGSARVMYREPTHARRASLHAGSAAINRIRRDPAPRTW